MTRRTLRLAFAAPILAAASAGTAAAHSVDVEGEEFAFAPARIEVAAGETVAITFENTGALSHNLTIPELGVATNTIQSGRRATVTVTADEPGTYRIECTVPGHAEAGMSGELVVTE